MLTTYLMLLMLYNVNNQPISCYSCSISYNYLTVRWTNTFLETLPSTATTIHSITCMESDTYSLQPIVCRAVLVTTWQHGPVVIASCESVLLRKHCKLLRCLCTTVTRTNSYTFLCIWRITCLWFWFKMWLLCLPRSAKVTDTLIQGQLWILVSLASCSEALPSSLWGIAAGVGSGCLASPAYRTAVPGETTTVMMWTITSPELELESRLHAWSGFPITWSPTGNDHTSRKGAHI